MSQLFVLVTSVVRTALSGVQLKELASFGDEQVVTDDGKKRIRGDVVLLDGSKEDFNKLLDIVGELWISTNPMCGGWQQMLASKT
jgi:hypothetical protein